MKSPPELWEELSEAERLAAHLGEFGEIRITRVEPETKVAWEGEHASGTVEIEPSGWGTRVTLKAELPGASGEDEPEPADEPEAAPEPAEPSAPEPPVAAEPQPEAAPRRGFWARLLGRDRAEPEPPAVDPPPEPVAVDPPPEPAAQEPVPEPEPEAAAAMVADEPELSSAAPLDAKRAQAVLDGTLDALGAAHHRPFSRT